MRKKKRVGAVSPGNLYNGGKTRTRREWRGAADTLYDYSRWCVNWTRLIRFIIRPQSIKGLLRYRWMHDYIAAIDLLDRSVDGLRGNQLRIGHTEFDYIVKQIISALTIMFEADQRIGGDKKKSDKIVVFDENMMEHLSFGFPDLNRSCPQMCAVFARSAVSQHSAHYYIDVAEQYGITGDVCTMPKAELGVAIEQDFPDIGNCMIHCNTTCDTSLMGNSIEDMFYGKPSFALAAPEHIEDELVMEYAADEIKDAIAFIEKQTGSKWDWAAYFHNMKMFNEMTRSFLEILDMQKTDYPQLPENNYALHREVYYTRMLNGRLEDLVKVEKNIRRLMYKGYKHRDIMCSEVRHRALVWGVQGEFYTNFPNWLIECWGIVPITHFMNLTSTSIYADEDTPENREQAYYDLADLHVKMLMRNRSEGGFRLGVEDVWRFCEEYRCDMIIMYEQIACKAMTGYHGIYEEGAAERGIKIVWVTHSLLDTRKASRQAMRDEVNLYMRTVLNETPLAPELEVIDDGNAW
ncbi:MAG: 2-hydroxyacyl-CoA dehydratase [Mogibacterium sp.]|nr:2-hydroxyacyl-CoA dehydratase [Mogibacterium sp.]MBR4090931.1 2-hydroxyacyl-CoA dehydratase [Mogibacterium sp.]